MEKILLIIPAYNEEENIQKTYQTILDYNRLHDDRIQAIVINDGSKDHTEEILKQNGIPHIRLIHNLGIGGAVQTGYKYALENNFDIAIQFDGDGQHDVNYVRAICQPILDGKANMVIGSRFVDKTTSKFKSTISRQIGIKIISFFINLVTKKKLYDVTSGFRAADRKLIERFADTYPREYPEPVSTTEVLIDDYIVDEVAVSMNERLGGVSSIRSWKNAYYMINVVLSILVARKRGK